MRKAITSTAMLRPFAAPKVIAALGALPRNPRTMLVYDASLAWAALLLLAAGLVMVYSASIAMAEASSYTGFRAWYFLVRHGLFLAAGLVAATRRVPDPDEGMASGSRRGCSPARRSCSCWCSFPASAAPSTAAAAGCRSSSSTCSHPSS